MGARILVVDDSPTIRKVVQTILHAGSYDSVTASDGQEALGVLETEHVDLVLVDFVMPRMNGYQFCRELRSRPRHRGVPVVLMSAKGDKIRGQFVKQTGALDAITKPFDSRGLIAVVEAALHKNQRLQAGLGAMSRPNAVVPESVAPESADGNRDPAERRVRAAYEFAGALADLVMPGLARTGMGGPHARDAVVDAFRRTITPASMGSLTSLLRAIDFGSDTHEVLAGDLAVISVAEVLQLLQMQHQSGALNVAKRGSEVTLFVRSGLLDMAAARGLDDEFLISRYFLEQDLVTREQIDAVLTSQRGARRLLGERLVEAGLVTEEQVREAVRRQTAELVYEVVRWTKGRFSFAVGASHPLANQAKLALSPGALVMEGFRRVDEWRLIEGSFDFNDILYRDSAALERLADSQELTTLERGVLAAIDGQRTVRGIVDEMAGSSFETCKIIYQFLNSRLVRKKTS